MSSWNNWNSIQNRLDTAYEYCQSVMFVFNQNNVISEVEESFLKTRVFNDSKVYPAASQITDEIIIQYAKANPDLKEINLAYCKKLTDYGIRRFSYYCKKLKKINLMRCLQISTAAITVLINNSPELKYLNLDGCQQDNSILQILSLSTRNLSHLSLRSDGLINVNLEILLNIRKTDGIAASIKAASKLDMLDTYQKFLLQESKIDDKGIAFLSNLHIKYLALQCCYQITEEALDTILSWRPDESIELDISSCNFTKQAIEIVRNARKIGV